MNAAPPVSMAQIAAQYHSLAQLEAQSRKWEKEHSGLKYHLTTIALLPFIALLFPLILWRTLNPWEGAVTVARSRFRRSVDELTKALAPPVEAAKAKASAASPQRPTQARRPSPSATLAA